MHRAARAVRRTLAAPKAAATPPTRPLPISEDGWKRASTALRLSPQQARIVEGLLRGMRDKQIAADLGLSVPTVRTYLARMFIKIGVADRVELILRVVALSQPSPDAVCRQT